MSASDAFLGLENDVTSRIAGWLALRLKHQPSDFISELSEFVRSNQEGMQNGLAPITSCSIRPNMPSAYGKLSLGRNQRLQGRPDKLIPTNGPLSYQPIRASRECRGFSLLPGDDSANRTISNAFRDRALDSATSFFRPLAWQDRKHREHGELSKSSKDKLSGVMAADSKSQQGLTKSIPSLTARSGVSRNSQRDGSGNSVLTAITSSSGRSSSLSHRGSLSSNAENNGLRVCSSRSGNSRLAVAAARAANATVDRGASYRESRS